MTNEAIIILDPDDLKNNHQLLFEEIKGKPFLHYQLSYLAENLFKHIVFLIPENDNRVQRLFGEEYMDIKITYLDWHPKFGNGGNIFNALDFIKDTFAFVFSAKNYFRLNLRKADDFRRMRDSKILLIGKKTTDYEIDKIKLFLDFKGKITNISESIITEEENAYNTNTWLINKVYFKKQFAKLSFSLFNDYLKKEYKENPQYCLACRQYFITMEENKDLEKAKYEFAEYYYH
ncbi:MULTISPECIES: hypothetical protein [unclassified Lentimicrobium]|uniref:hypothetical protein n=1 Tax=unclassified Lentimicrobium TaxID=2677434 RepID=UPI001555B7A9|nr:MULTISPECIES: hypothetical protein [unclassified Lentimicrobium]NPD46853.1 hypothetical protein [Lentimicrobium sp. S6]NPD84436.1 hypothetical protein [Lentimicrobium sp. L6]